MDGSSTSLPQDNEEEEEVVEEEYVLFDLDAVMGQIHIPANAPYVLSGLDTLNPILTIDGKIKLIGEYEETLGTCLVFSENSERLVLHFISLLLSFCLLAFLFYGGQEKRLHWFHRLKLDYLVDAAPVVHEESGPSEANLFLGACIVDGRQAPAKQVKPINRLQKILKFRLMEEEAERIGSIDKQMNNANE